MNHDSYMRGPLARERARRLARINAVVTPLLAGAVVLFFLLGAMYTDHQYIIQYGSL